MGTSEKNSRDLARYLGSKNLGRTKGQGEKTYSIRRYCLRVTYRVRVRAGNVL